MLAWAKFPVFFFFYYYSADSVSAIKPFQIIMWSLEPELTSFTLDLERKKTKKINGPFTAVRT